MPRTTRPNAKRATKPRRPAHRPTKFTAKLAEKICELVALGWFMKDAARHYGIPPETVCRWVAKHEDFRRAYEQARRQRTVVWEEQCIEIAENATSDYTTDKDGSPVLNQENLHLAQQRLYALHRQIVRFDPSLSARTSTRPSLQPANKA
jgi:hypothetical protein